MTRQDAIYYAKFDVENFNYDGYVITHYDKPSPFCLYWQGKDYDPEKDYDYVVFSSYEEMRKFLSGSWAHNCLDDGCILKVGERITDVYSKSKLIILENVSRETLREKGEEA